MTKKKKILIITVFTILALSIFIIDYNAFDISFYQDYNSINKFIIEICNSFNSFNIAYGTLGVFIYYYFYNTYFNNTKIKKYNLILATILTIITMIGKIYDISNSISVIYSTPTQIFKTLVLTAGFFLVYYAIIKRVSLIKFFSIKKKLIK